MSDGFFKGWFVFCAAMSVAWLLFLVWVTVQLLGMLGRAI